MIGDIIVGAAMLASIVAVYYLGYCDGQVAARKQHAAFLRAILPRHGERTIITEDRPTRTAEEDLADELLRQYETDGVQ